MANPEALNRMLRVAYLLDELYARALASATLLPAGTPLRAAVQLIRAHKAGHVAQLLAAGGTLARPAASAFDFSGGGAPGAAGPFPNTFTQSAELLRVAQLLEDTAVRAYKGELDALRGGPALALAARLQAATARHAAKVRSLRAVPGLKPWITGATPGGGFSTVVVGGRSQAAAAALVYGTPNTAANAPAATPGEDNRVQGPITFPADPRSTEAFDEPMTAEQAVAVAALFLP